jgi:predicted CXXCH cytochrome family protein
LQENCVRCHAEDLKLANDSHPEKNFRDPGKADRVVKLVKVAGKSPELCVTCHREHKPGITGAMGLSLPGDYCVRCHWNVADNRPTHKGATFTSCASAGCHNFHDNRGLYEDFLLAHLDEPAIKNDLQVKLAVWTPAAPAAKKPPLTLAAKDAPADWRTDAKIDRDWLETAHAKAGVNCSGCHKVAVANGQKQWVEKPGMAVCTECHKRQWKGFVEGKHGMRLADGILVEKDGPFGFSVATGLSPMSPALARRPMKPEAHDKTLTCTTCHGAHAFDREKASIEACTGCHADEHTKAYFGSPHYARVKAERKGDEPKGSGVTCATCHMPLTYHKDDEGRETVFVHHNQNFNLRPNEKMIRTVCSDCHGLGFTIDALADPALIKNNFTGRPSIHIESLDWVKQRKQEREAKERAAKKPLRKSDAGDTGAQGNGLAASLRRLAQTKPNWKPQRISGEP